MKRLLLAIVCAVTIPTIAHAQGWTLSGTVYGGGSRLSNTTVEALADGTTDVVAAVTTDSNGQYSLTLLDGTYDLRVSPPSGSGFGQETIQNLSISGSNRTYDVILLSTGGSLSGTVRGRGGAPIAGVNIHVYNTNWTYLTYAQTDADGHYAVAVSGAVNLQLDRSASAEAPSWSMNRYGTVVSGSTTLDVNLDVAEVSGLVKGEDDAVVAGATLSATSSRSSWGSDGTSTHFYSAASALSAGDGSYSLLLLAGDATFNVFPPASSTLYSPLSTSIPVTGDLVRDFVLPAPQVLSGTIRGYGGAPLSNVNIYLYTTGWQYLGYTTTDVNGTYSLLASGPVNIQMDAPASPSSPAWSMNRYGIVVDESMTMDLNLAVVRVDGFVRGADLAVVPDARLATSINFSTYEGALSTHFYSSSSATSGTDGAYTLYALAGSGTVNVRPPVGSEEHSSLSTSITLTADTTMDFVLPVPTPLSGTIRGYAGVPLPDVNVYVYTTGWQSIGSTRSDADGRYTINVHGAVNLQVDGPQSAHSPAWSMNRYGTVVTEATTLDIDLDVVRIAGTTTDSNGAPVAGVTVASTTSASVWVESTSTHFYGSANVSSGADGAYTLMQLAGSGSINIHPPALSGFQAVSLAATLVDDLTQRIILQQADFTPPQIVAGPVVVHLSDTSVSISWTTNEASTSLVEYGVGGLSSTASDNTLTTNHEITLMDLAELSTYQFRVGSVDKGGNGPAWSAIGTFATQGAPGDITAPQITSGPTVTAVDQTSAIIQWTTDEPASTSLSYGLDATLGASIPPTAGRFTRVHSVRLTGLSAETTYYARATSADPDANTATSSVFSFTTLAVPDTTAPVITSGPLVLAKTNTSIVVYWTTDEPATSGVSFNDGTSYGVLSDAALSTEHQITLAGLSPSTLYSITVSSTDAAGNGPTLSAAIQETTDADSDGLPPVILSIDVVDITETSATVRWTTDEPATSVIAYGVVAGMLDNVRADLSATVTHEVVLTGLVEGTTYYFSVRSADPTGNVATSDELSFETESSYVDLPPTAPGPITAPVVTRADAFEIVWGASTDDIALTGYEVIRNGEVIAIEPFSATSRIETGLAEGTYTYQIRAVDSAGNTASSAIVTVIVDRTAPLIEVADVSADATGVLTVVHFGASASDNVDPSVMVQCAPASGTLFAVGDTAVSCTATDAAGNESTAGFVVTVTDNAPPLLNVPASVTREASSADGATVSFGATASDLVDGATPVSCSPSSGSMFALGLTTVTCTATDVAGNMGSATFEVSVVDTTAPQVTVPTDGLLEAVGPAGATATFSATASDAVDGTLTAACTPASGFTFPLGATTVTCVATDASGNRGSASFTIRVRDTLPPVITVPEGVSAEATSAAGAEVVYVVAAMDAVSGSVAAVCSPASTSLFAIGTTRVTCLATDGAGNSSEASFDVVVRDSTAPSITTATPSQSVLWPPNHQMVPLSIGVTAFDSVDAAPVCSVVGIVSNEAVNGLGDGDTGPDWKITGALTFELRAERSGRGAGRVYTITTECADQHGNASRRDATVSVPSNLKK